MRRCWGLQCAHLLKCFQESLARLLGFSESIEGGAAKFDCVISAIPLLHLPVDRRLALVLDLLERVPVGRPVVQITYGLLSPVVALPAGYEVRHLAFMVRNIPPAQLWIYRKIP